MLTIAHGSFVAFDVIDAAMRTAASKQYIDVTTFLAKMCLRVNFVGIGRFTIALATDIRMGIKKSKKERERLFEVSRCIRLRDAKIQLYKANLWVEIKEFQESQLLLEDTISKTVPIMMFSIEEAGDSVSTIINCRNGINENNPGLLDEISDMLL